MRFTIVTIFPEMFASALEQSILGRACSAGLISVDFVNPRDFTQDRHRSVDDTPYGGGPGMVMKPTPLVAAVESIGEPLGIRPHRILLSPAGAPLAQERVKKLAETRHLVLVCGRYEGVDERVVSACIDEELSLGDFVLSGGEIAAMAVIDAVARYVPGVLGEATSTDEESFSGALLEYPQYTRPPSFRGMEVPQVLLSGNHGLIADWRRKEALRRTAERRPELLARHPLSDRDRRLWAELSQADLARRTYVALVHHPVYDRNLNVVTSALTNLDIHDIARSTTTYGGAGYFVVTPIDTQRDKVASIIELWQGGMMHADADARVHALSHVMTAPSFEAAAVAISERHGQRPIIVSTSARSESGEESQRIGFDGLRRHAIAAGERPLLLLFGTGWGLADEVIRQSDLILAPICGRPVFNHLSVRSAVAIVLDRLFGLRES